MPKIVNKEEMQVRIMDAALSCFSQFGYHSAKMTDVAKQAGLAKGTLYLYFPSKDALTVALLKRYFSALQARVDKTAAPETLDDLMGELHQDLAISLTETDATKLLFDVLGPGFSLPEGRQVIQSFFDAAGQRYGEILRSLQSARQVREGIDCDSTGRAIASMADGLVIHRALFAYEPLDFSKRLDAAISVLRFGLLPAR